MDTAVVRLFNEQLMANLLLNGAKSLEEYQVSGAKPFGTDLLAKLQQAQGQLQNGQGVSQQQLAGIQSALPTADPTRMAATQQFLNR